MDDDSFGSSSSRTSAPCGRPGKRHRLLRGCLLWPGARFRSPEEARDRLAAVFQEVKFRICDTVGDVPEGDAVWIVRRDPSYPVLV